MRRLSRIAALVVLAGALALCSTNDAEESGPADQQCDKFIAAIRDGNYDAAEKLVDPQVQSIMTAAAIEQAFRRAGRLASGN